MGVQLGSWGLPQGAPPQDRAETQQCWKLPPQLEMEPVPFPFPHGHIHQRFVWRPLTAAHRDPTPVLDHEKPGETLAALLTASPRQAATQKQLEIFGSNHFRNCSKCISEVIVKKVSPYVGNPGCKYILTQQEMEYYTAEGGEMKQKSLLFTLDNLNSRKTATIPRNSYNCLMGGCNGNKILLSKAK